MNTIVKIPEILLFRFCCKRSSPIPSTRYWMIDDNGKFFSSLDDLIISFRKKHPEISEKQIRFILNKFKKKGFLSILNLEYGSDVPVLFYTNLGTKRIVEKSYDSPKTVICFDILDNMDDIPDEYRSLIPERTVKLHKKYRYGWIGELDLPDDVIMRIFKHFGISSITDLIEKAFSGHRVILYDDFLKYFLEDERDQIITALNRHYFIRSERFIRIRYNEDHNPEYQWVNNGPENTYVLYRVNNLDKVLDSLFLSLRMESKTYKDIDDIEIEKIRELQIPYFYIDQYNNPKVDNRFQATLIHDDQLNDEDKSSLFTLSIVYDKTYSEFYLCSRGKLYHIGDSLMNQDHVKDLICHTLQ